MNSFKFQLNLCLNRHLKYKYYMQLRQLDPSIKDDFQISFPEIFTSLNQKMFDIQLLERMSKDFEWSFQKVLITQVKNKLPQNLYSLTMISYEIHSIP